MRRVDEKRATKPYTVPQDDLNGIMVKLPSRGVEYDWLEGDEIMIRPKTVREEKFVAQMTRENSLESLSRILERVILKPIGVDPLMLTQGDRLYLFLWLRIQVTPEYRVTLTCPKCRERFENFPYSLDKVPIVEVPEEYKGFVDLELPKSKSVVTLRMSTGGDEGEISKTLLESDVDEWVMGYAQSIQKVDGKELAPPLKYKWVEDLDPVDFGYIRQFYTWVFHGPDYTDCPFKCAKCGKESRITLPFRPEFYLPTISFQESARDAILSCIVRKGSDSSGDSSSRSDGSPGTVVVAEKG